MMPRMKIRGGASHGEKKFVSRFNARSKILQLTQFFSVTRHSLAVGRKLIFGSALFRDTHAESSLTGNLLRY